MTPVLLGLGSNVDAERHLREGIRALEACFGQVELSPVYETPAVGFVGDPFLNLVVRIHTHASPGEVQWAIRRIEVRFGRHADLPKFSPRNLDIDLLAWGCCAGVVDGIALPRSDILDHAYVLWPLADLCPNGVHPSTGRTYRMHRDRDGLCAEGVRLIAGLAERLAQ